MINISILKQREKRNRNTKRLLIEKFNTDFGTKYDTGICEYRDIVTFMKQEIKRRHKDIDSLEEESLKLTYEIEYDELDDMLGWVFRKTLVSLGLISMVGVLSLSGYVGFTKALQALYPILEEVSVPISTPVHLNLTIPEIVYINVIMQMLIIILITTAIILFVNIKEYYAEHKIKQSISYYKFKLRLIDELIQDYEESLK